MDILPTESVSARTTADKAEISISTLPVQVVWKYKGLEMNSESDSDSHGDSDRQKYLRADVPVREDLGTRISAICG